MQRASRFWVQTPQVARAPRVGQPPLLATPPAIGRVQHRRRNRRPRARARAQRGACPVMTDALSDSTGVAWVVLGTLAAGLLTALLLLADFLFADEDAVRNRRRRQLPTVVTTEAEAQRRIRRLLLPTQCCGPVEPKPLDKQPAATPTTAAAVSAASVSAAAGSAEPLGPIAGVAAAAANVVGAAGSPLLRWQQTAKAAAGSAKQRLALSSFSKRCAPAPARSFAARCSLRPLEPGPGVPEPRPNPNPNPKRAKLAGPQLRPRPRAPARPPAWPECTRRFRAGWPFRSARACRLLSC